MITDVCYYIEYGKYFEQLPSEWQTWAFCIFRLHYLQQNSEDTIGVDELELMRFLHVPVEGLILLFQGIFMFLLTFFMPLVSILPKTVEKHRFSDIFGGYKKKPVA